MLRRPRENGVSSWLYLKQNTARLQKKRPTPLRFPPKKQTLKKARTTNQGRALMAATRVSRVGSKKTGAGPLPDIGTDRLNVCITPESGHRRVIAGSV